MSKGTGRIERAIEAAFKVDPDGYFSVRDLAKVVYPNCRGEIDRLKRGTILRAAHNVAKPLHWVVFRSEHRSVAIFANGLSLRSCGLGNVRAVLGDQGIHKYTRGSGGEAEKGHWMPSAQRIADRLETDDYYVKKMRPGGEFALVVEYHMAVASGETERAAKLDAIIKQAKGGQHPRAGDSAWIPLR